MTIIPKKIEDYAKARTRPEPALLNRLERQTYRQMESPTMLTGRLEGRFLKIIAAFSRARRVLDVGTFTGYSALSIAEALPKTGRLYTCEIDHCRAQFARQYFKQSPHGHKIHLLEGPADESIRRLRGRFDMVFLDADKENLDRYYELVLPKLRTNGLLLMDNALWKGRVLDLSQDKETRAIDRLNRKICRDKRVENVMLTVRDGINLVRKL